MMLTPLTARNGQKNQKSLLVFAIGSVLASAATPVLSMTFTEALTGGKVSLDVRYRYEFVDQDNPLDQAHASTVRTRLGYRTGDFKGFALLESDGNDLTRQYTTRYISKPTYASVAEKLSRDTHLVSEGGKNAPEIYVFADPNCIFCHKFWQQTRDWVAQGKVRLHWVMVGFLKPSSLGFSAAIMNAEDRAGALQAFEENFGDNGSVEGISELTPVPANLKAALEQHSKWMAELGFWLRARHIGHGVAETGQGTGRAGAFQKPAAACPGPGHPGDWPKGRRCHCGRLSFRYIHAGRFLGNL